MKLVSHELQVEITDVATTFNEFSRADFWLAKSGCKKNSMAASARMAQHHLKPSHCTF